MVQFSASGRRMLVYGLLIQGSLVKGQIAELFGSSYIASVENQVQNYTEQNQVYGDVVDAQASGKLPTSFDYVIAGGGTAGLVLANRLSDALNSTVAVVEAGSIYELTDPLLRTVPGLAPETLPANDPIDWNYTTVPQEYAQNRTMPYFRGKCLGGSSARNFLVHHRGTAGSYEKFAELTGNHDYDFDNFLQYFERTSSLAPPNNDTRLANASTVYTPEVFSKDGPIKSSFPNYVQSWSTWVNKGLSRIGLGGSPTGFNMGNLLGSAFLNLASTPEIQQRITSESAYLRPAIGRKNLFVFYNTTFGKASFDAGRKIESVSLYNQGGERATFTATKEVIFSGGAFNTPQMLLLSGIGPGKELASKGIETIVDSPNVGKNLMDHVYYGPTVQVGITTLSKLNEQSYYQEVVNEYVQNATGPMTDAADFIAFQRLSSKDLNSTVLEELSNYFPDDWPHIEYIPTAAPSAQNINATSGAQYASLAAALVAPLSRGEVTLASGSVWDKPLINPNYLSHPVDRAVAVAGIKKVRSVFDAIGEIAYEVSPGTSISTDAQILSAYQLGLSTVWHAACSARMGTDISNSVADGHGRVFGVTGLRVVDASAFPILPPGHPAPSVYALAELISEYIINGDGSISSSNATTSTAHVPPVANSTSAPVVANVGGICHVSSTILAVILVYLF